MNRTVFLKDLLDNSSAADPDILTQFGNQYVSNVDGRRTARPAGEKASLIARSLFVERKRHELAERPGVDLHGIQKESKPHFISRKVWSA